MSFIEAIILGIIQGLTEFLPVSSSGHLVLGEAILQTGTKDNLAFTVIVHFATVLSTVVIFRKEIFEIIRDLFEFRMNDSTKYVILILISMIPVFLVGLFLKDQVEALFEGKILMTGLMLIVTGLVLFITLWSPPTHKRLSPFKALLIGIAQAIAVLPGISRSGTTISTALLLGVDRTKATKFSFLMVIPPIFGIMLIDGKEMFEQHSAGSLSIDPLVILAGFFAAFITGLFACKAMVAIVKKGKLQYFAYYCFAIGITAILFSWLS